MTLKNKQNLALTEVVFEVRRAKELHPGEYNSAHEGYAILLEEVRELETAVFFGKKKALKEYEGDLSHHTHIEKHAAIDHRKMMREEAVQIAAVAIRFISELTEE